MAINEKLTERVRAAFTDIADVEEKKMFSGIAFIVDGKMSRFPQRVPQIKFSSQRV